MRLLLVGWGSRGDVVPLLAVGRGLTEAGHQVSVATARDLAPLVTEAGLESRIFDISLERDQDPVVKDWLAGSSAGRRELQLMRAAFAHFGPILGRGLADHVADADAVISGIISTAGLAPWARRAGRPLIAATLLPQLPTALADATLYPMRAGSSWLNRLAGRAQLAVGHTLFGPPTRAIQRKLGLRPEGLRGYLAALNQVPTVIGVSPLLLPPPPDWPAHVRVTGAWRQPLAPDYRPPAPLADFLAGPDDVVYIGFGSMPNLDPGQLRSLVIAAVEQVGLRAVLAGVLHEGGAPVTPLTNSVVSIATTPFGWLFPRLRAVVAHGGVGTTDAALLAGRPLAVIPHIGDQYFWGRRVHALGAGPVPLPRQDLSVAALAGRLDALLQPGRQAAAAELGHRMAAEDGVAHAVRFIHERIS